MEHMRWLTLRLGNNQSIGPKDLLVLWSDACETNQASVTRDTQAGRSIAYALHAPTSLAYPKRAELRMRDKLEKAGYTFTMGSLADRPAPQPVRFR
ncbi:MAG: hypothetical protein ACREPC_12815 [Stenotrophomonas sp.]|uniref:hypothetical protein n=1 Tax=Stenotrophomonas sp. TaxID=69392 RepID=UPI003D6CBC51